MKGIFDSDCVDENWARLTLEEINKIDDPKKRVAYKRIREHAVRLIINPLFSSLSNKKRREFLEFSKGNDRICDLIQELKILLDGRENALDVLYKRHGKF